MKKIILSLLIVCMLLAACACGAQQNNAANTSNVLPDFEEHGIKVNLSLGKEADYKTVCNLDHEKTTVGKVKILSQKVYKFGDTLPDDRLKAQEEYEWIEVKAESVFGDENALDFGVDRASCVSNYYDLKYYELRIQEAENGFTSFSVKVGDKAYNDCLYIKDIDNIGWTTDWQSICNYTWYFKVPEKYDGMTIVFFNAGIKWEDGKYIYEVLDQDALVYRVEG